MIQTTKKITLVVNYLFHESYLVNNSVYRPLNFSYNSTIWHLTLTPLKSSTLIMEKKIVLLVFLVMEHKTAIGGGAFAYPHGCYY